MLLLAAFLPPYDVCTAQELRAEAGKSRSSALAAPLPVLSLVPDITVAGIAEFDKRPVRGAAYMELSRGGRRRRRRAGQGVGGPGMRSEEHTSELQSPCN